MIVKLRFLGYLHEIEKETTKRKRLVENIKSQKSQPPNHPSIKKDHPLSASTNNPLIPFNNKTKSLASFALSTTPSTSSPSNLGSVPATSNPPPAAPVSISNHPSPSPPTPNSPNQNLNLSSPAPSILSPRHVSQNLSSGILCLACASSARWCAACASRR